jgi:hypothetical protein
MAETAGTIGIPNIKNEILPYLENYSRRQERAAALEATRQRRQQELQFKKEQEAGKLKIPDIPSPKEGYFSSYIAKKRKSFVDGLVAMQASGKVSQGELETAARAGTSQLETEDVNQAFNSKLLEDEAKQLQERGVVGANKGLIQAYVNQGMNSADPDKFFASPHLEGFTAFATGDYRNISPAKIMENTLKGKKPSYKKIEVGDRTEDFEVWDMFNLGREKDPISGADIVTAKDVNIGIAEMLVNADPIRQKLKDNWIASRAQVVQVEPAFVSQYGNLPDDQKKLEAQKAATKEFYDEAGRAYQNTKYGVAYDEAGRAAGGGSKNAYAKYATGMENRRLPNNSQVSVYGIAQPNGKPIQIELPLNYRYLNTTTNKEEDSAGSGASLSSPAVGWAAKNIKTGKYIDPSEYKNTRASEVKFVPGVYGIKSNLQTRTGTPSMVSYGGSSLGGPGIVTDQIFIEEGVPGWKVLASDIFKAKGSSYEAAKAKALKETKSKFLQGTPKKKKFRTSK